MYSAKGYLQSGCGFHAMETVAVGRGRPIHLRAGYGANRSGALGQVRDHLQRALSGWNERDELLRGSDL